MGIMNNSGLSFFAACAMAVTAANAGNAVWQGGATGDINNPANWNDGADITTDFLNFGQDVTATMSQDTTVYDVFGNKTPSDSAFENRTVVFDMGGHTLRTIGADGAAKQYIRGNSGTTYVFTNGTFWCSKDGVATNTFYTSENNATTNMSIVAIGDDTTLASSFALSHNKNISLHILNGAKAYASFFGFGGSGEIKGGSAAAYFSSGCYVGALDYSVYSEVSAPPHGSTVVVDNATLTSMAPETTGAITVGNGNFSYDNVLVATNGATVAARNIYVGSGGVNNNVLYTSSNNTFKVTGTGTSVTTRGSTSGGYLVCGYGYSSGNDLIVEDGASVDANNMYVGYNKNAGYEPSRNTFRVAGVGTTVTVVQGIRCGSGLSSDNSIVVEDGAKVTANTFHVGCDGASSNNTFRASGTGTTVNGRFFVGGEFAGATNSFCNSAIFENGAMMTNSILGVNTYGIGNTVSIRSGATAISSTEVDVGGRSPSSGSDYNGACGRLEVIGEGTTLTTPTCLLRNNTGDASKGQELFVGDGACMTNDGDSGLRFFGDGNRVVVSNGTLSVKHLRPNGQTVKISGVQIPCPATNTTFRIEGANACLVANTGVIDVSGISKQLVGAPIFEFVIPEGGWASAPVAINQAFTIGDDTVIRIDAESARAFSRAGGGTVPLISTGTSGKSITADMTALTAGASLPAGCSLKNEGGVISVEITSEEPTILSFR